MTDLVLRMRCATSLCMHEARRAEGRGADCRVDLTLQPGRPMRAGLAACQTGHCCPSCALPAPPTAGTSARAKKFHCGVAALSIAAGPPTWEIIGRNSLRVLFAPTSTPFRSLLHETTTRTLPDDIALSLLTMATSFVAAAALALPPGFAMGGIAWLHELLQPVLTCLYTILPVTFTPFLIVWFGVFEQSRLAIVVIMCLVEMLVITLTGVRSIDRGILDVALSFLSPCWRTSRSA